jgi:hypothetical protein
MKLRVNFKTPDAVADAIFDAMMNDSEDALIGLRQGNTSDLEDRLQEVVNKFVEWNECLTIEFDTEEGTATVVPVNE